ncbi:hypothetical protein SAMN05216570_0783 [Dyella sp. OK004]|nr:hypothetical protein SAMN05216570_0783 [Dyella sp. OK004]
MVFWLYELVAGAFEAGVSLKVKEGMAREDIANREVKTVCFFTDSSLINRCS